MMSNKSKKYRLFKAGLNRSITIDPTLSKYLNHPYFVKKAEAAKEFIARVGMPEEFTQKSR